MKSFAALLIAAAASAHAQFAVMHTNGVVVSPPNLTIQQSNVAGLASALDSKLGTNPTLAISNTAGLQSALDGKLATNGTLAVSNVSGLQSALDGKLATNGSAAALTNFPSFLLSQSNGIINYTNTNVLSFTKGIEIKGPDTTNIPTLYWATSDGIGNGSMFAFSRAHATNLWPAEQSQTNWSQLIWGLNVRPNNDGSDRDRINTNMGAIFLTIENEWKAPAVSTSPISEIHLSTIDRNGDLLRVWGINQSQTNASNAIVFYNAPVSIQPSQIGWFDSGAALSVSYVKPSGGSPHLQVLNPTTNNTDTRIYINQNNNIGVWLVKNSGMELWRNVEPFRALITSTNGVIIGAASGTAIASRVHLGGDTRIDGAITFDNTTNAATTRTNLGLGSGITTNVSSGTLQFSNGILIGHAP